MKGRSWELGAALLVIAVLAWWTFPIQHSDDANEAAMSRLAFSLLVVLLGILVGVRRRAG